jgi:hypothetical protein
MEHVLQNGTVAVKINDKVDPYFQSHKGVRQGDPLSPLLFNIIVDCLTRMIIKAQQNNLVTGLVEHLFNSTQMTQFCVSRMILSKQGMLRFFFIYMSKC